MRNEKDRVKDFCPPDDWRADHWGEKTDAYDPNYERILFPWLATLSPDMIRHYVRNMDTSDGMTDRYVAYWLIDQPNLDASTARLLFWKLLNQYPYHGSEVDREDTEHGVPQLGKALERLRSNLQQARYNDAGISLSQAEIDSATGIFSERAGFADARGWTTDYAPFAIPQDWSDPIAGRPAEIPRSFPAPTDPLIAVSLMSGNFPTRKEMYKMAEKFDVIEGKDRMLLWGCYALCGGFVAYLSRDLWLGLF